MKTMLLQSGRFMLSRLQRVRDTTKRVRRRSNNCQCEEVAQSKVVPLRRF